MGKKQSLATFEATEMTMVPERWSPCLDKLLDELFERRESRRENALSSLVQEFINNDNKQLSDFVEDKYATILYNCLNSIKKGSSKEVCLAARLVGLVALTTTPGGHIAQQILQESVSPISQVLKSPNSFGTSSNSSLIDCLAVIMFLGGSEKPEETEEALKTLSYLVNPEKTSSSSIASMIAAISLVLTSKDALLINPEIWREPIRFLTTIVEKEEDLSLWLSAEEALALASEIPSLHNFLTSKEGGFKRADLKPKVLERTKIVVHDKTYMHMVDDIFEFLDFIEVPEESVQCSIEAWGEFLQMKFWKHLLGDWNGASEHKEDEVVDGDDVEVTCKLKPSKYRQTKAEKRLHKSPKSLGKKGRTKGLNTQRGYYTIALGKSINIAG